MAKQLYENNAGSMLAVSIAAGDLSLQVGGGHGALFPLPSGGDYFLVTLMDAAGNREIVKCTARSTDVLTIVRAQEGTTAQSWIGGACRVECRVTAGTLERFLQREGDALTGNLDCDGFDLVDVGDVDIDGILTVANPIEFTGNITDDAAVFGDSVTIGAAAEASSLSLRLYSTRPRILFDEEDQAADEKRWDLDINSKQLELRTLSDDGASTRTAFLVDRGTGVVIEQITIGNVADDPDVRINCDEFNVVGNSLAGLLEAGTYTPTLSNDLNVSSVSLTGVAMYMRVGSVVRVSLTASITPTAAGVTSVHITLPIASDFDAASDAAGSLSNTDLDSSPGRVTADISGNVAEAFWNADDGSARTVSIDFSYVIK